MSKKEKTFDISRRGFLKGLSGGIVGTAAVSSSLTHAAGKSRDISGAIIHGPDKVRISFTINGKKQSLSLEPRVTLLDAIRDHLGLTGAKRACNRGECGACTVILNGKTVLACSMLAIDANGAEIETVEGLAKNDQLHPVQKAFIKHDAMQCGFCTPGFVVTCASFLRENPNPGMGEIKTGVSGNLCRCGTYPNIFAAVEDAATIMRKGG